MAKVKNNYIDKDKFEDEILAYKKACKIALKNKQPEPIMPSYLGKCFKDIAQHLTFTRSFIKYTYKEDMIGDGIENCIQYWRNYNPNAISKNTKGNNYGKKTKGAFAYFTQVIFWAFVRRIQKEKKEQYVKLKSLQQSNILNELTNEDLENMGVNKDRLYENMHRFIGEYEDKLEEKKNKKILPKKKKVVKKKIGPLDKYIKK